jgi:aminopeptidase N
MLVQNYIYSNSGTLPRFRRYIDSTGMMIDYFSKLFGRYRFWNEKYGHCMAPLSGGMEHQTMSTMGFFSGGLTAHELGHQWFGDNATCGTWSDIFVNEGFASYCEYLYYDRFNSHAGALADINDRQINVKSFAGGSIYTLDTSAGAVFDSRISYDKGACVIHMLRFVINNDSLFFNALKLYQNQFTDSTATIQDFKNVITSSLGPVVNGMNIDTFFQQWIYLEGFPEYTLRYNQNTSGQVLLQANQVGSVASSVPYFITPIEVRFRSATGDTVVRFFNNSPSQLFSFNWNKTVTSVVVDPEKWLIYRLNSLTKDTTLSVDGSYTSNLLVSPNPTAQNWDLSAIPAQTQLMLFDIQGKLIWSHLQANGGNTTINSEGLPAGIYLLHAINSGSSQTIRLLKQ